MTDLKRTLNDAGLAFYVTDTGGGCRALEYSIGGFVFLVTDGDHGLPSEWEDVAVGVYESGDPDPLDYFELPECDPANLIARLRREVGRWTS